MTIATNHWEVYPRAPQAHLDSFPDLSPLIVQILYNRGIYNESEVGEFVYETALSQDPVQLKGVSDAVERIAKALGSAEKIVVYGDYDADGVTATALMIQALQALRANVVPYIPDRFDEGYGLNKEAIAELAGLGASLVITVDCGIRSIDEVAYGNELGLDFIITDHHKVSKDETGKDIIPPALAVINPKQVDCPYPFEEFAGVGLAFKLVQALNRALAAQNGADAPIDEDALLDLVAIGTVADLAPLIGENRLLVKAGLAVINQPTRTGLIALINQTGLKLGHITAGTIGFVIGPRLNAAGRLSHAQLAYQLLTTDNVAEAAQLAQTLDQVNIERQQLTQQFVDQARDMILADEGLAPLYFIVDPNFNQGVVGLVASRISDEFYRPSLVAQQDGAITKGSGRSIPEFDITQALDECADLLVKYGGHAAAAGFTVKSENLAAFQKRIAQIASRQLGHKTLKKTLTVDAELNLRGVSYKLVEQIQSLQPFGYNNPTPKFLTNGLEVKHQTTVGKENKHLKLKLFDGRQVWDAIGFGLGQRGFSKMRLEKIDAVYALEINVWNGRSNLQLNLKDIRLSQAG